LLENVRNGNSVLLEIKPKYYSTWDYSRNNWIDPLHKFLDMNIVL
jgi:hypothetical protein